jgi:hypothetical protein
MMTQAQTSPGPGWPLSGVSIKPRPLKYAPAIQKHTFAQRYPAACYATRPGFRPESTQEMIARFAYKKIAFLPPQTEAYHQPCFFIPGELYKAAQRFPPPLKRQTCQRLQ